MYDFGTRHAFTGYRIPFRAEGTNHCPGCGNAQWIIGRTTAECAFCATALPLHGGTATSAPIMRTRGTPGRRVAA